MQQSITLTPTQERVGEAILSLLAEDSERPCWILLAGLSGVGKDTLLKAFAERIRAHHAELIDFADIVRFSFGALDQPLGKRLVISVTPSQAESVQGAICSHGIKCTVIRLSSMSKQETERWLQAVPHDPAETLERKMVAELSLGIFLLALTLLTRGLTQEEAEEYVAQYLGYQPWWTFVGTHTTQAGAESGPFLQTKLPDAVWHKYATLIGALSEPDRLRALYEETSRMIRRRKMKDLAVEKVVTPFFSVLRSTVLYSRMLIARESDKGVWSRISFFIPGLSEEHFAELTKLLLFQDPVLGWDSRQKGSLPCAFGAQVRKCGIVADDPAANLHIEYESESHAAPREAALLRKLHAQGDLRFWPPAEEGDRSFYIRAHEHDPYEPTRWGWAIESWCQARGIPYWAENGVLGMQYVYRPENQDLLELEREERISIRPY